MMMEAVSGVVSADAMVWRSKEFEQGFTNHSLTSSHWLGSIRR